MNSREEVFHDIPHAKSGQISDVLALLDKAIHLRMTRKRVSS